MAGYAVSFVIWWGVLLAIVAALRSVRLIRIKITWLLASIALSGVYTTAVLGGGSLFSLHGLWGELSWNWEGKVVAISASLAVISILSFLLRDFRQSVGLTLTQREGSIPPAIFVTLFLVSLAVAMELLAGDGTAIELERLLFQATMPGLDEEIFYRGVFLYFLSAAVMSPKASILGAPIGWGGVLVTVYFGLGHSLFVADGEVAISWVALIYTGLLGFGMLWLRERTGSLLFPILAHNLINFGSSFF